MKQRHLLLKLRCCLPLPASSTKVDSSLAHDLQNGLDFDPSKTCAVMVGHKEMCEAVTKILESKGVSKEHILLNF